MKLFKCGKLNKNKKLHSLETKNRLKEYEFNFTL